MSMVMKCKAGSRIEFEVVLRVCVCVCGLNRIGLDLKACRLKIDGEELKLELIESVEKGFRERTRA